MIDIALAITINSMVNSQIDYKAEAEGLDHWQTVGETFDLGTGDCEDFALAKVELLREKGVTAYIAYAVTTNDVAHMVATVDGYILDNMTNEVVLADESDLRILYTYDIQAETMHFRNQNVQRELAKVSEWKQRQY